MAIQVEHDTDGKVLFVQMSEPDNVSENAQTVAALYAQTVKATLLSTAPTGYDQEKGFKFSILANE